MSSSNAASAATSLIGKLGRLWKGSPKVPASGKVFNSPSPASASNSHAKTDTVLSASKLLDSRGQWRTAQFVVDADWNGSRLDRILARKFNVTASLVQKLIRLKKVRVERASTEFPDVLERVTPKPGLRLSLGDSVSFSELFVPERKTFKAEDVESAALKLKAMTLFEDENLLVLNKPAGMLSHPGDRSITADTNTNTSPKPVHILTNLLERTDPEYRLVHRLDKETSGVLLVAKRRMAAEKLNDAFADSQSSSPSLRKTYIAVLAGVPKNREGLLKTLIYRAQISPAMQAITRASTWERMTTERGKRAEVLDEGKAAITEYRVISAHRGEVAGVKVKLSLVEFRPLTGRTHQLRVHAAEQLGCPIVGDSKYGHTTVRNLERIPGIGKGLHLHARAISISKDTLQHEEDQTWTAPLPDRFAHTLTRFPLYLRPPRPGVKNIINV